VPATSSDGSSVVASGICGTGARKHASLALRERRLDAADGIVEDLHPRHEPLVQSLGGAVEVQLDDFRRARADEEQRGDVGSAIEQLRDTAIEFLVGVGQSGQVALAEDVGGEARLSEDHDAGGALDEMGACPRAHDEEERILHLAVQPDDAGQSAEDFALSALPQDRQRAAARGARGFEGGWHGTAAIPQVTRQDRRHCAPARCRCSCRRAARSLSTNWMALTAYVA